MAFDLKEEDYDFNEAFGGYSDDENETYEEESEFDIYTEEEADARWGGLTFIQLVDEIDSMLANSRKYFFSRKKRVVDAELVVNLAKTISDKMPGEFREAERIMDQEASIISEARSEANAIRSDADFYYTDKKNSADALAEKIIADAKEKARNIVSDAQAHADELVSNHVITGRARDLAQQINENAKQQAANIIQGTETNCQEYIKQLTAWGAENIKGVTDFANAVIMSSINLNKKNIEDLENVAGKFINAAAGRMDALSRPPKMGTKQPVE